MPQEGCAFDVQGKDRHASTAAVCRQEAGFQNLPNKVAHLQEGHVSVNDALLNMLAIEPCQPQSSLERNSQEEEAVAGKC